MPPRRWRDRLDMIPKYRGGVLPGEISPFTNDRSDDLIFPLFKNGPYIDPKCPHLRIRGVFDLNFHIT